MGIGICVTGKHSRKALIQYVGAGGWQNTEKRIPLACQILICEFLHNARL